MIHNRIIHDALRATDPDETRLVRSQPPGTVTLITTDAGRKNAFLNSLPEGRTEAACIRHDGTPYWLVQAPTEEAQRALRRLGWVEVPASDNPTQGRTDRLKNRPKEGANRPDRKPATRGSFRPCRPRRREQDG